ncbi:amidohydrolase [Agromyces sp. SYSU T0242]|uniref:amidohydrolase n=1 Tax=Agromyces litoreus TaxID=3158561 RepID=UPI003392AC14
MAGDAHGRLAAAIRAMPLVDHHVHGLLADPTDAELVGALSQAAQPSPADAFDSQQGFALRRHCAPLLGLDPFAPADDYLARRRELGADEVARRLLGASGIAAYLVDDGFRPDRLMPDERMARLAAAPTFRIARLERLAEGVMAESSSGADFVARLTPALERAAEAAVGFKTIAAHRCGLDLDPERPSAADVLAAATAWHARTRDDAPRLAEPTIIRHLIWWTLEHGRVLQVHAGFGDADLVLEQANPARMQALVAATAGTGGRIAFLHCHPYVREASWMAHVFPHVVLDVGLAVGFLGANADTVVREAFDLAPFSRVLFSTDAWGVPERVLLGARLWRDAAARVLAGYVDEHGWPEAEAVRVAEGVAWRNAEALYGRTFVTG